MKKKIRNLNRDQIDLFKIISLCWREKSLIISITLLFTVASIIFSLSIQNKFNKFKSEIIIKEPPRSLFLPFERFINKSDYQRDFKNSILSIDNLEIFVKQNNKIDNFKNYIESNNLNLTQYFQDNFGENGKNKYYYIFYETKNGEEFLKDYVEFIKLKSLKEYKDELKNIIKILIAEYERNLFIAKKINQKNPIFFKSEVNNHEPLTELNQLYYLGSNILSQQILHLKAVLNQVDSYSFDYNPIYQKPITNTVMKGVKDRKIFIFYGFVFGFFASIIIVFIKNKII